MLNKLFIAVEMLTVNNDRTWQKLLNWDHRPSNSWWLSVRSSFVHLIFSMSHKELTVWTVCVLLSTVSLSILSDTFIFFFRACNAICLYGQSSFRKIFVPARFFLSGFCLRRRQSDFYNGPCFILLFLSKSAHTLWNDLWHFQLCFSPNRNLTVSKQFSSGFNPRPSMITFSFLLYVSSDNISLLNFSFSVFRWSISVSWWCCSAFMLCAFCSTLVCIVCISDCANSNGVFMSVTSDFIEDSSASPAVGH